MKTAILLVLGVTAALAACSGDDFTAATSGAGGAKPDTAADCKTSCATKLGLACSGGPADCQKACEDTTTLVAWCADPAIAYQHCLGPKPATSYECKGNGAQPKSDVCLAETDAVKRCWYEGPDDGSLPDLSADCKTVCDRQASLPCALQDCEKRCKDALDPMKECNGAWAAFVACAAKTSQGNYECNNGSPTTKLGYCDFEKLLILGCGFQI